MKCAILAIGEEILEGSVTDTNSGFIARALTKVGISPNMVKAVPDDIKRISTDIRQAMEIYPLVITTGGLGPTFDDVTMEAVANACATTLNLNELAYNNIRVRLENLGVHPQESHYRQARLPKTAIVLPNDMGTACGTIVQYNGSMVISLPGVPFEMRPMILESVIPYLLEYFEPEIPYMEDLHFANIPESDVDKLIVDYGIAPTVKCIINASIGEVIVKIRGAGEEATKLAQYLKTELAYSYIYSGSDTAFQLAAKLLTEKSLSLAAAESCTGGLLSQSFTALGGASDFFLGSVVSYANEVKKNLLKVSDETLINKGAVSQECAMEMLAGIKMLTGADINISITGIAGPSGGTALKPVGTVYIGLDISGQKTVKHFKFTGDRNTVQQRAAKAATFMLLQELKQQ